MIYRNKRDQEAWLREKTLESLKANSFLQEGDIIQVAEDNNFYKIVSSTTEIPVQNNLYAEVIPSELSGNIATATKLKTPRNISLAGDVTGNANFDGSEDITITAEIGNDSHTHSNDTITSVDAAKVNSGVLEVTRIPNLDANKINSGILDILRIPNLDANKITSGTIDIDRLPKAVLERCVIVQNDEERFALTKDQVQNGDAVKVITPDNIMYAVIDDTQLSSENGYTQYSAAVKWETIKDKPTEFNPKAHTHLKNEITDFPESIKNPHALTISLNGASQGAYDGSESKEFNITPASIGAQPAGSYAAESHTHPAAQVIQDENNRFVTDVEKSTWNGKANASHGNHVPATQTANNSIFLRNDNTWATITPANIGAQAAGSYAAAGHTHDDRYYTESEINTKLTAKYDTSGGTISGNVSVTGTLTASKVYNAVWNDYAEFFERGEETEVGDIIALDENSDEERYVKATSESKVIVGVHSDTYAHLIGGENPPNGEDFYEYNIKKFIPVGLAGRVKVKIIGSVKKGELITISPFNDGVGISINNHCEKYGFCVGRTIGQALEDKDTDDIGLIKILIMK